jgi:hypothetical protein
MEEGMPSLRTALRRAKRAGAIVTNVRRTGELRVTAPLLDRRVTLNARRHDATRELVALIADLEAIPKAARTPPPMPDEIAPQAQETPRAPAQANGSIPAQVRRYLRSKPASSDGWIYIDGAKEIVAALGVTDDKAKTNSVSTAIYWMEKGSHAELQRDGRWIRAIRFLSTKPVPITAQGEPVHSNEKEPEPEPRRVVLTGVALVPDTPHLAGYAEARKLAQGNPMLRVELSEHETEQLLGEAVRLYHWLRASQGKR